MDKKEYLILKCSKDNSASTTIIKWLNYPKYTKLSKVIEDAKQIISKNLLDISESEGYKSWIDSESTKNGSMACSSIFYYVVELKSTITKNISLTMEIEIKEM
jgi:hypothetical protein